MNRKTITLYTGGSRSGKSSKALEQAMQYDTRLFIATAEAFDAEMEDRITNHQFERKEDFSTLEEPLHLSTAIATKANDFEVILVDCLTIWLGNLMHYYSDSPKKREAELESFLQLLKKPPCNLILVTNEVGMGIIPENPLSREFKDLAGRLNQDTAALADHVTLMVSGLPLLLKP